MGKYRDSLEVRFLRQVKEAAGCWSFEGRHNFFGYGEIWFSGNGKRYFKKAHRLMWEIKNGPIPEGMLVCHKCDNPGCVNPEHLFLGTYDDNNKDKMNKGRCNAKKNEFHPMAKLTAEQVAEIRKAKKEAAKRFWGASEYAKKYSVSLCTIFRVANGTHWKE